MYRYVPVILLLLAAAGGVLLPALRARRDPLSKSLVRQFGIRPSGPGGTWTRRDRAFSGLLSLLIAACCIGVMYVVALVTKPFTADTTANYIATGVVVVLWTLALMAVISGIANLARAPFTKSAPDGALSAEAQTRQASHLATRLQHPAVFLILLVLGVVLAIIIAYFLAGAG